MKHKSCKYCQTAKNLIRGVICESCHAERYANDPNDRPLYDRDLSTETVDSRHWVHECDMGATQGCSEAGCHYEGD